MATSRVLYQPVTDNTSYATYTAWKSQVFTTTDAFIITRVDVKWAEATATGNFLLELMAVDGSDKPTGSVLSTGTGTIASLPADGSGDGTARTTVTMSSYTLSASTKYCLRVRAESDGGQFGVRAIAAGAYAGGSFWTSADSGSNWSDISWDMDFDIWGEDANYVATFTLGEYAITGYNWTVVKAIKAIFTAGQYVLSLFSAVATKTGWTNQTKHDASATNLSKNDASATNLSKNDASVTNISKS